MALEAIMDNEEVVKNWQRAIIQACESKLDRSLTDHELAYITNRGGFMALEILEDNVNSLDREKLTSHLNSDSHV